MHLLSCVAKRREMIAPASPLETGEAEFAFQFLVVALDAPAQFGRVEENGDGRVFGQRRKPASCRLFFAPGPFDEEPFERAGEAPLFSSLAKVIVSAPRQSARARLRWSLLATGRHAKPRRKVPSSDDRPSRRGVRTNDNSRPRFGRSGDTAPMESVDCLVVGAGVLGLVGARALARAGREVIVVESQECIGSGISSRNSKVIHPGIYYPTGLEKTLTRAGPLARLSPGGCGAPGHARRVRLAGVGVPELPALREAVPSFEAAVRNGQGAGASAPGSGKSDGPIKVFVNIRFFRGA
jgi:FAD dependent oxidoreductase